MRALPLICVAVSLTAAALAAPPVAPGAAPTAATTARPVTAPKPTPTAPLDVQADTVTLDQQTGQATFVGHVQATQGKITLRCDRLTARLSDAGGLTDVVAHQVTLTADGWTATAQTARYATADDRLTLEGAPTVTRPDTVLRGERIVVFPATGRVTIERARGRLPAPRLLDLERALAP